MRSLLLILIIILGALFINNSIQPEIVIEEPEIYLSVSEIINETNKQRTTPLRENQLLNSIALFKAEDMLNNQYFAHTSPLGKEAKDLADNFNYNYVVIGENLAMGMFENSAQLVQDWMDSPGHRENIVSDKYTEIGVGVVEGIYEGENTWMAVQIFGTSRDICPEPNLNLLNQINTLQSSLELVEVKISNIKSMINQDPYNNRYITEHNNLVDEYNKIHDQLRPLIDDYNRQINENNQCLSKYGIN